MVKRSSRIPRIRAELSEETAQAFKQALKLRNHREEQLADDKHCKGVGLCEICDEYERSSPSWTPRSMSNPFSCRRSM